MGAESFKNSPGGTPLYRPYRYVPPQGVGFFRRFGLKTGLDFAQFGLESGMVFEETTGVYERIYRFNYKRMRKKKKYANLKWILIRATILCTPASDVHERQKQTARTSD